MSKIITLKDRITQESMYPITTTSAVLDGNGKSIEIILTEKSEELDIKATEAVYRAKAAEDSITSLNNLNNTSAAQEELNNIKTQIETNKSDITTLKSSYSELKSVADKVVKTDELTNNIESGNSQIPTTTAVKTYIEEKSSDLMSYLINTTTTAPNYIPNVSGQILVNTINNTIYFSPGGSTLWFALEATPMELPNVILEGYIIGEENLELVGDVYIEQDNIIIDNGGDVQNDTLIITGVSENGSVTGNTVSLSENPEVTVTGSTLNLGRMKVVDSSLNL